MSSETMNFLLGESADEFRDIQNDASGDTADQDAANRKALDNPNYNFDSTSTLSEEDDENTEPDALPDDEEREALEEDASLNALAASMFIMSEDFDSADAAGNALLESRNIVRLSRKTKINNLTTRSALVMARRKNDPLFIKYSKFNGLRLKLRAKIVKKYGSKAATYARKLYNNTGKNMATAIGKK